MFKFKKPALHLGPAGINSPGYGADRGVIWPAGIRPTGVALRKGEEIISSDEYSKRMKKQSNG